MIKLGTAKLVISPPVPVRLCGYACRTKKFDGITEDIFLRVHCWQAGTGSVIVVYADLLWWNPEFVEHIRTLVLSELGIPGEQLLFTASHNHSGPGTGNSFTALLETGDREYTDFLAGKVIEGIRSARSNLEPVSIGRFDGTCCMNVYRRILIESEGIRMRPNYAVPADTHLSILGFYRIPDGNPKGFAVQYACHANLSDGNTVHPDYAGLALNMFDETYPGSVAVFLQGCTADLRPNSVLGTRFVACDFPKVKDFAEQFFDVCKKTLEGQRVPVEGGLSVRRETARLPLHLGFSREDIERLAEEGKDEITRQWAQKVLGKKMKPYEELEITRVDLGSVALFFFNAEMSQYYAEAVRKKIPGSLCVCYTNGMIGYLCVGRQIVEGGYEPCESARYFALCGTYKPEIENIITTTLSRFDSVNNKE